MKTGLTIKITEDINLSNLDDFLSLYIPERETHKIFIELSDASYITAPGAAMILLYLQYLKTVTRSSELIINPPKNKNTRFFLNNIRFFVHAQRFCSISGPQLPPVIEKSVLMKWNILHILFIPPDLSEQTYRKWIGYQTSKTIIDKVDKLTNNQINDLGRIFFELARNVFDHSNSFGYIAAQKFNRSNTYNFFIGDLGIGIYKSLHQLYSNKRREFINRFGPIWDEQKAVDVAFIRGLSSKSNGEDNRGIGLATVLDIIDMSKGYLICRSGRTKAFIGYEKSNWTTKRKDDLPFFPGVQIEITLRGEENA